QLGILKRRPELVPEGFLLLPTAIDAAVERSGTRPVNLRVGAKRSHVRGLVASVPGFEMAPHHLHVLLRHRPRSISRGVRRLAGAPKAEVVIRVRWPLAAQTANGPAPVPSSKSPPRIKAAGK